jgi:hypothetical protein
MTARFAAIRLIFLSTGAAALLAGCATTPLGPTVQAMPGPGKTFDAFQNDNTACKAFASDQVKGQADAANQRAAGTAVLTTVLGAGLGAAIGGATGDAGAGAAIGAASGATGGTAIGAANNGNDQAMIQQQFDTAFMQCMYAKGEQVPGYAPVADGSPAPAPVAAADPLVRSTQSELIRLGYLHSTADGYMGPRTRAAISSFQQSHSLSVTGAASPSLLAQLQSTPASATAATTTPGTATTPAPSAHAPSDWVAPSGGVTSASTSSPAAPSGWVAPTKQ